VSLYEVVNRPAELENPLLLLGMVEGWIDTGFGAAGALAALLGSMETTVVATFDNDRLLDQRARRPVMRLVDGINTGLSWPEIELRVGKNRTGRDVLLLTGPEPDMYWRAFVADVVELAHQLGVTLAVALGAFPAPTPHTRPVRLASTATTQELAAQVGSIRGTLDAPANIHAALEIGLHESGIPAVGIWARVPHYIAGMPYPAASAALLEKLAEIGNLELDTSALHAAAAVTHERINELIAASEEHTAMVRQLEISHDHEVQTTPLDQADIPSGDALVAELERFLRGQGEQQ
jgi:proteasome assembly chaperone (PAC2) family protein